MSGKWKNVERGLQISIGTVKIPEYRSPRNWNEYYEWTNNEKCGPKSFPHKLSQELDLEFVEVCLKHLDQFLILKKRVRACIKEANLQRHGRSSGKKRSEVIRDLYDEAMRIVTILNKITGRISPDTRVMSVGEGRHHFISIKH
jgi:hypothetical protein